MKNLKLFLSINLVFLCGLLISFTQAQALVITPGTDDGINQWSGNDKDTMDDEFYTATGFNIKDYLYKSEVPKVEGTEDQEEGDLASSYDTYYYNSPTDPAEAVIEHADGNPYVQPAYLFVKGGVGAEDPLWYVFYLGGPLYDWNGTDDLELCNFWPGTNAISHVALYGTRVSEPATMLLLGSGLLGLTLVSRRRFRKQ